VAQSAGPGSAMRGGGVEPKASLSRIEAASGGAGAGARSGENLWGEGTKADGWGQQAWVAGIRASGLG
jgi:hypothetical protein